jgi:hypothetical protein
MNAGQKVAKRAAGVGVIAGEPSAAVLAFLQNTLVSDRIAVSELTLAARAEGLLGDRQSVTTSKLFKSAKKALRIQSVRDGFAGNGQWFWVLPVQAVPVASLAPTDHVCDGLEKSQVIYAEGISTRVPQSFSRGGWWGLALPSPETSIELAIEAPRSLVYGEDHSRPDQCNHHTGADDHVGVQPDHVPSEWNKGIARLDHGHAPHGVPLHRWRQFVTDCHLFMTAPERWSKHAAALGWDTVSLFGCCSTRPLDHLGSAGLLWNLAGRKLTQLHKDWAMISAPDGSQRTFHRRPFSANLTLPWRLR